MSYIFDIATLCTNTNEKDLPMGDVKNTRLREARAAAGLSQAALAAAVGVTRQTIGMIEAGRFNPSLALCVAICRALGKTLNDLFWEEEERNAEKE